MTSEAAGEVEKENNVLVIKRIHVIYHLKTDAAHKETVERVFDFHADFCPVYRSIHTSIDITTELQMETK